MSKGKDKGNKNVKKQALDKSKGKILSEYQQSKKPHIITLIDTAKDAKSKK